MTSATRDAVARNLQCGRHSIRSNAPPHTAPTRRAFGSDVVAEALRDLNIPYICAQPGRELSRTARLDRQLSGQQDTADVAVPARGEPPSRSRTAMQK